MKEKPAQKADVRKRLVLLDAHAIIHRAYHALPAFENSKGQPTGALYGVITMLIGIVEKLKPDYVVACFDLPEKTFRHEAFEDYKGTRKKIDDALISQLERARDVFESLHIPMYDCPGFEADDILGTIAEATRTDTELEVIIASGDMDTLQLIENTRVRVFTLKKGITETELYDENSVKERFGFGPLLIPDYKGLRGDTSDNIPGVKGIGEKTATALIVAYGELEHLYRALAKDKEVVKTKAQITERIATLLLDNEEEASFSKTLATIRRDAPINFSLPKLFSFSEAYPLVKNLCVELEFKSLITRLERLAGAESVGEEITMTNDVKDRILTAYGVLKAEGGSPTVADVAFMTKTTNPNEMLKVLESDIEKNKLDFVYRNIELPLVPIVREMEKNGILIDREYFVSLSHEYHESLSILEKKIFGYVGHEFNINSPKQLGTVIFDELKLGEGMKLKKSAGGGRSTRESELEKLKEHHPIIVEILSYRELQKLLSTYIDTLPNLAGNDNRIHATFLPLGTTTGRFSSENPNMQNIPIKSELGKRIRNGFVAPKGTVLVAFDYSQIELRAAAILSRDEYMSQAFKRGDDVHTAVAIKVFGVSPDGVTYDMRRRAKIINFGILYGMGVNALKEALGTSRKEAEEFYDNYFAQFPTIANYLENVKSFAKDYGYTVTLFGRRRYFKDLKSPLPYIRAMAERMAINAPIQGTAADITKLGMIRATAMLEEVGLSQKARLILQVHDEIIFEVENSVVSQVENIVESALVHAVTGVEKAINRGNGDIFNVPLAVGIEKGQTWGTLE